MLSSRRIITRGVIDMATSAILSSEGYIHTGPVAECESALADITRSIEEIGALAKAGNVEVTKQIGEVTKKVGEIDGERQKSDARILALEQKILTGGAGAGAGAGAGGAMPNIGELVAKGLDFGALQNRHAWVRQPIVGSIRNILRSVLVNTGTSGASPETGFPTIGVELPGGPFGFTHRRLSILAALTSIPVTSAKVEFPKLTDNTDNAQVQADEGAAKASTDLGFIMEILPMATIAHYVTASKQVLADSPLLVEFINQVMLFSALKKFENLIVSGNGTTDKVSGLLTQGTVYAPGAGHSSDMIGESIANLTALGFTAHLGIMNAFDHFDIISARNTLGSYIAGGWSAASPLNLWGVPTVPTAALAAGTAIVMDTTVVRVLDREEANLQVGFQNDNFVKNEVTLLAELRGNLAVQNAQGVNVINIANDSP
jgi:HK97 family phage major capsid protein